MKKITPLLLSLIFICISCALFAQTLGPGIGTVAGAGDNIPAVNAAFRSPVSVSVDASGNYYIVEQNAYKIKKVNGATGLISTFAGTGSTVTPLGDGGPALSGTFTSMMSGVLATPGAVFVADYARIRKIDLGTGIITTVVGTGTRGYSGDGGAATSAMIDYNVSELAVDGSNNLYFTDQLNHRIRKVNMATGIITTVVGNGTDLNSGDGGLAVNASISNPLSLAVNTSGDIYFGTGPYIRKVTASTGVISTIAGNGTFGYTGDGGLAINAPLPGVFSLELDGLGNLYLATTSYSFIKKIDLTSGILTRIAGAAGGYQFSGDGGLASAAGLATPRGVSCDSFGNIFFVDASNSRVRKINVSTGIITTVAGGSSDGNLATQTQTIQPDNVYVDAAKNIYIGEWLRIRKVDATTGVMSTIAGNEGKLNIKGNGGPALDAGLSGPTNIEMDAAGNIYFLDYGTSNRSCIRKIDAATGIITSLAGNDASGSASSGDGGPATSAAFHSLTSFALHPSGDIYLSDAYKIRKIAAATGIITTFAGSTNGFGGDGGPAASALFGYIMDLAFDPAGNLYVVDDRNDRIRKINMSTGIISTYNSAVSNAYGIDFDAFGNLFYTDGNLLKKIDVSTGTTTTIAGNWPGGFNGDGGFAVNAMFQATRDVFIDVAGDIYVADAMNDRIRKIHSNQVVNFLEFGPTTFANPPITLTATASSSLPITYVSSNSAVATVSGNILTITGVGSTVITANQAGNSSFAPAYRQRTLVVTPALLTATAVNQSRFYGDPNPTLTISYSGFVGSDNASVLDTQPVASTTAIQTSPAGSYPISLSSGADDRYTISVVAGTLTVNKAELTATPDNKTKVYGQVNPALTTSYATFKGSDNVSVIDVVPSIATTATQTSDVGVYPISLSGGSDNNYSITLAPNGTLTITKATQTVTFGPLVTKTYGDGSFTLNATSSSGLAVTYSSSNPAVATVSGSQVTIVGAGSTIITASQAGNINFNPASTPQTLVVNKAVLTATANPQVKIYGDNNPDLTIAYSGFKGADNASVIDTPPTATTPATASSNTGTYSIIPQGGSDNNYIFSFVNGALTIDAAPLTVTAQPQARLYGDPNPTLTISYTGFKVSDDASVIDVVPTSSTTAIITSNAGDYPITLSGGSDNNYALTLVNGLLTVGKAPLTATANPKTKIYGSTNPPFTISYSGFKGSDNESVVDAVPTSSTTATTTSSVGDYPITLTGGSDNNYAIALINGTLSITQATLTATADAKTKVYGNTDPTFTISYSGFTAGDNPSVIDTEPTPSSTATITSDVGNYPITLAGGADNNYIFSFVSGTLSITKAPLTATAENKTKVYGSVNPGFTIAYSGFKGSDNAAVLNTQPSPSTTAGTMSPVGNYPINLSAGSDNNYTITNIPGTLAITRAALTATAANKTKVYGDNNPALTINYTGFKGSDNASVIDSPPTIATTATIASPVTTYPITLAGGTDNNYTITRVNGTLTITKAPLVATADSKSKVYGDPNPPLTISYSGFKVSDDESVLDTKPSTSTTATTMSNVSTYPITLAGGADNNYTISLVHSTMTISKALLTVTADAKTKVFGQENPELTFTYAGFVGLETLTVLDIQPSISTTAGLYSNAGTYPITLTGGSDNNYSYSFIHSTLTVYKEEQYINFGPISDKTVGDDPFIIFAIGGPTGNPVTYTSSDPLVIRIFGNVATVVGTGSAIITASQAGNLNYNTAASVMQTVIVHEADQVITFDPIDARYFGDESFSPGAVSSSGLPVTLTSSDEAVATINGDMVEIVGVGSATITASQAGNANFGPASDVTQTLTVNASPVVVTAGSPTICFGTGTSLDVTGAATYTWSPSTGLSATSGASVVAAPITTTTYTVTATYANGFTTTATTTINVNAIPLAAGGSHSIVKYCGSCGGGVTASGLNSSGQLGDGSTTQRLSPVTIGLTGISAVSAGTGHSLFLKDDGTVWASGLNTNGQLGVGSVTNKPSPTQVVGLTGIIAISAGNTHSLFLKDDGTVWACGLNSNSQLGDGTTTQQTVPVQVVGLTDIVKISAGGLHSLFLKNDGTVWACGRNANGQLGDGTTTVRPLAVQITSLSGIVEIAGGGNHSHFLKNNGLVYATGLNTNGQLGNGSTGSRTTPGALATINYVIAISGGASHTIFLRNDGTAWSTGLNTNSQLGDGTSAQATSPVLVNLSNVSAVDAGATHSLFLTTDGLVWGAGRNANGQLGDGTTTIRPVPVQTVDVNPCGRFVKKDQPYVSISDADIRLLDTYPNPVNNVMTIDLPRGAATEVSPIYFFDNYGRKVISDQFNVGEASKNIETTKLTPGVYLLRVKTAEGEASKKVIVVH